MQHSTFGLPLPLTNPLLQLEESLFVDSPPKALEHGQLTWIGDKVLKKDWRSLSYKLVLEPL